MTLKEKIDEILTKVAPTHPVVLIIVAIVAPPGKEEKDHGEDNKHKEDGAGVDIDGNDCETRQ